VVLSILFAPNRGVLWETVRDRRNRSRLHMDAVLGNLDDLARHHADQNHGHAAAVLEAMHPGAHSELREMEARGWARRTGKDEWAITPAGRGEAERRAGLRGEDER